jgi:hypothetical protein
MGLEPEVRAVRLTDRPGVLVDLQLVGWEDEFRSELRWRREGEVGGDDDSDSEAGAYTRSLQSST